MTGVSPTTSASVATKTGAGLFPRRMSRTMVSGVTCASGASCSTRLIVGAPCDERGRNRERNRGSLHGAAPRTELAHQSDNHGDQTRQDDALDAPRVVLRDERERHQNTKEDGNALHRTPFLSHPPGRAGRCASRTT